MAKIYISSTYEDLKEERKAAAQAIRRLGHQDVGMEDYVAADERPVEKCLDDVKSCDGYVGIFGWKYGYIPDEYNEEKKSITNLEYDAATNAEIPRFIFLYDEYTKPENNEVDDRILTLRTFLRNKHLISYFKNCDDLSAQLSPALSKKFGASLKPDIPPLLPYMCDRSDQEFALREALKSLNQDKPRRPLSAIIHGDERECHDKYKDRLIEKTLPKLLKMTEDDNSIKEYLIEWPRPSDNLQGRCERMKANIADKITGDMGLNTSQVGATINQHESPVMVYTFVPVIEWQKHEKELINFWMKYWSDLPNLIVGRKLFVFLNIQYKNTSELGIIKKHKYNKLNEKIHRIVDKHAFEKYDSLYSFTMPELSAIAVDDVEYWVRTHAKELVKVEKMLPKIRDIFIKKNSKCCHMEQLAEDLENLLGSYLKEEDSRLNVKLGM